jgi:hypothetical protein
MAEAGRPTLYTEDVADIICEGIANAVALVTICKPDDMPQPRTVYRWRRENDAFRHNYENARQDQGDKLAEDILSIADNGENDYMEILSKEGKCEGYKQNGELMQRSKLRVESRKWLASKFNRAFSDKIITEIDVNDSFADRILRARERGPNTEEA